MSIFPGLLATVLDSSFCIIINFLMSYIVKKVIMTSKIDYDAETRTKNHWCKALGNSICGQDSDDTFVFGLTFFVFRT